MVKYILPILMATVLTACSTVPVAPKVEYKVEKVPTYIVPKPVIYSRPTLQITSLTAAQKADIGALVQAYAISLKQVMQYACLEEKELDKYYSLATAPASTASTATPAVASSVAPAPQALSFNFGKNPVAPAPASTTSTPPSSITLTAAEQQDCDKQ